MSDAPTAWMPRDDWEALVRGENCPLCAECTSGITDEGYTVARLPLSQWRFMRNQFLPGYSVVICSKHVAEPYHLTPDEQVLFFKDLMHVAQALDRVFAPTKMNIQILGNMVPHLHAHLVPRYYGDLAPGRPIDPNLRVVTLTPDEYDERLRHMRAAF